jgi:hypothetical protein
MARFQNEAEKTAITLAEALNEKGFAAMRQAEEAAERFQVGKQRTRQRFQQKGLSRPEADLRWSGSIDAKKALADNGWYMQQAIMYHSAAAAQYARALYLRAGEPDGPPARPVQRQGDGGAAARSRPAG